MDGGGSPGGMQAEVAVKRREYRVWREELGSGGVDGGRSLLF